MYQLCCEKLFHINIQTVGEMWVLFYEKVLHVGSGG